MHYSPLICNSFLDILIAHYLSSLFLEDLISNILMNLCFLNRYYLHGNLFLLLFYYLLSLHYANHLTILSTFLLLIRYLLYLLFILVQTILSIIIIYFYHFIVLIIIIIIIIILIITIIANLHHQIILLHFNLLVILIIINYIHSLL
jgi:hypothetical protein